MHIGDSGDVAISEGHRYMDLTPENGSSVIFFSLELYQRFPLSQTPIFQLDNLYSHSGLCRLGIGSPVALG